MLCKLGNISIFANENEIIEFLTGFRNRQG